MMQTIPYLTQGWAGGIVVPSEVAWTWAAALLIPLILSALAIVGSALRQRSIAKDEDARVAAQKAAPVAPPTASPWFGRRAVPRRLAHEGGAPPQHALP